MLPVKWILFFSREGSTFLYHVQVAGRWSRWMDGPTFCLKSENLDLVLAFTLHDWWATARSHITKSFTRRNRRVCLFAKLLFLAGSCSYALLSLFLDSSPPPACLLSLAVARCMSPDVIRYLELLVILCASVRNQQTLRLRLWSHQALICERQTNADLPLICGHLSAISKKLSASGRWGV